MFGRELALDSFQALSEGLHNVGRALQACGRAIKDVSILSSRFTRDTARFSYNLAGQYTFPIEQELTDTVPPAFSNLNTGGVVLLTIPVPLTIASFLLSISLVPLIGNSIQSFSRTFVSMTNIALDPANEIVAKGLRHDTRGIVRHLYGSPGILPGLGLGVISVATIGAVRIVSNTPRSFGRAYARTTNLFLQKEDEIKMDEKDDRSIAKQILGSPGLLAGGLFGFISGYIASNAISLARAFARVTNLVLDKEDELELPEDKRPLAAKIFTGPAWFMGGMLGGIAAVAVGVGRIISNMPRSFGRGFAHACNLFLQKEDEIKVDEKDDRSIARQILGSPGLLVGGVLGFISGYIATNAISLARAFARVTNLVLDKEDELKLAEDNRPLAAKELTGPGLLIGGILGGIAAIAVGFGRIITNIPRSFGRGFAHACNLFLEKTDEIKIAEQDDRSIARQLLGSPGLLAGGLLGFIGGYIVSNAISFGRAFARVTNLVLDKEEELELAEDNRHLASKIVTGPAWFIGGMLGGMAAVAVGFGRIITNLPRSLGRGFAHACNLFLQKKDEIKVDQNDDRSIARQLFGSPGLLVGGLFGFISGYIATHAISFGRAFARVSNLVLDKEDELELDEDNRPLAAKIITGPAWFIGGTLGGIAAIPAVFGRIISNMPRSFGRGFVHTCNLFLQKADEIKMDEHDDRSIARQLLGSPGLLAGGLFGFIGGYIASSAISLGRAFSRATNLALDKEDEIILDKDNRHVAAKISTGPAWAIGGILGGISAVCVGAIRIANQSRLSFQALSGSFLNGAAYRPWFDGLGGDKRSPDQKAAGALGYVAACAVTLPVAITGWTLTKAVPTIGSLLLGIAFSPIITIGKLISKCCSPERFPAQQNTGIPDQTNIERGLKNIFSSLNAFGRLSPGATVKTVGDGEENIGSFIRKCFTFNAKSVTEKTLDILLTHYRNYANRRDEETAAGFFTADQQAYNAAIEEAKNYYRSGCCETTEAAKEALQEIDNIAGFVQDYMQQFVGSPMIPITIPKGLYDVRKSWSATFWGNSKRQAASIQADNLTQEHEANETESQITGRDNAPAFG